MTDQDNRAIRPECQATFARIFERLESGDESFREHRDAIHRTDLELTELRTNMQNLVKSMDGLTKGIWGMVMAIAGSGVGFIFWFIQQSGG